MKDIALNSQVMVLFEAPRELEEIWVLRQQTGIKDLEKAYHKAIKESYGYLVINLQAHTPEAIRLQSDIVSEHRRVFKK